MGSFWKGFLYGIGSLVGLWSPQLRDHERIVSGDIQKEVDMFWLSDDLDLSDAEVIERAKEVASRLSEENGWRSYRLFKSDRIEVRGRSKSYCFILIAGSPNKLRVDELFHSSTFSEIEIL